MLLDPFRPGVLEKLGLGPDVFLGSGGQAKGRNERLVFARVSGYVALLFMRERNDARCSVVRSSDSQKVRFVKLTWHCAKIFLHRTIQEHGWCVTLTSESSSSHDQLLRRT